MNRNMLHFIQIQMLSLSIYHKWKEVIDIVCKTPDRKSKGTHSRSMSIVWDTVPVHPPTIYIKSTYKGAIAIIARLYLP
jgi:hypothetical protein